MNNRRISFLLIVFSFFNSVNSVTVQQFISEMAELPIYQDKLRPNLLPNQRTLMFHIGTSFLNQYLKPQVVNQLLQIHESNLWKLTMFLSVMLVSLNKRISEDTSSERLPDRLVIRFPLDPEQIVFLNAKAMACNDWNKAVGLADDILKILKFIHRSYLIIAQSNRSLLFAEFMNQVVNRWPAQNAQLDEIRVKIYGMITESLSKL